jgi:uncharacterized membrane protein
MPTDQLPPPAPGAGDVPFNTVDSGRGVEWLKGGWAEFIANPGIWVAIALIYGVAVFVLNFIPFIGGLAVALLTPVIAGGIMLGCRARASGGKVQIEHRWAGFQGPVAQLIIVGAITLGVSILIGIVVAVVGGAAMMGAATGSGGMAMGGLFLGLILSLVLVIPLAMATWFAIPLVAIRGVDAITAMKSSFKASLANLVPLVVLGVIVAVALFIGSLPFGLGLLVVIPIVWGAQYASFRDIFGG